jgi:peptidoglycan/LPS O-acetylase OafA/YrhL
MDPTPVPAPGAPDVPKLSTTVLFAMGAMATVVLVAIFAFILFVATLRIDERLWWTGLCSMIFALGFFFLYASTQDRRMARPLAGAFFVIGAGSLYGSIFTGGSSDLAKLAYLILLSILVMVVLAAIFVMSRDAEQDAVRRAMRKHTP